MESVLDLIGSSYQGTFIPRDARDQIHAFPAGKLPADEIVNLFLTHHSQIAPSSLLRVMLLNHPLEVAAFTFAFVVLYPPEDAQAEHAFRKTAALCWRRG
jgi:hypothetical protein